MQNVPNIVRERLKAAAPAVDHPDADLLTAFAEHSLPDGERSVVLEHLARCGDCRDVVSLALPSTEKVQPILAVSPSGWLTWPALRWGVVAAGIVAIASFGIIQYRQHLQPATTASALKQSPSVEVAANEPRKLVDRFADKKEKLQTPSAPAFADSLDANALANENHLNKGNNEKKRLEREETTPARVPAPQSSGAVVSGSPMVRTLPHGPRVANQYQQQMAQNQAPRLQSPAANGGMTPAAPMPDGSGVAIAKAKPLASAADASTNNQLGQQQAARSLTTSAAPGQIGGYVVDPTGAVVPNARITITPSDSGRTATAVTNSQGAWLIAGLTTGNYKAQAEAPGFKATILDFNYDFNQPSMYSFTLSPGNVSEAVQVSSANAQVQTESTSVGGTLASRVVSQPPTNGRGVTRMAALSRWAVSAAGALQRSFDQGKTWQTVDVAANSVSTNATSFEISAKASRMKESTNERTNEKDAAKTRKRDAATLIFRAVAATGSDVWAGGSAGALYHSTDAGNTFTRVVPAAGGAMLTGDIVSLDFSDPQHGKLSTSTSELWTTSDSGQTWQKQ